MQLGTLFYYWAQWVPLPSVKSYQADLTGKVVIVTGSNVGLGLEAARHLARMNPGKLILACRDLEKAEVAKESIAKDTGCQTIECWKLDQGEFASVKEFADKFDKEVGKLDLVIANAGMANGKFTKTVDGWESTIQVNHLSTALLSFRLLPYLMKATADPPTPRLVIVSSDVHYRVQEMSEAKEANILETLGSEEHCEKPGVMSMRYSVSKLLNVFFTRSLAEHLPPVTSLTVNCLTPGWCHSELGRNGHPPLMARIKKAIHARSTENGSHTLLHAALAKDLHGKNGKFLYACQITEESDLVISKEGGEIQKRIWDETVDILTKVDPQVKEIISQYLV